MNQDMTAGSLTLDLDADETEDTFGCFNVIFFEAFGIEIGRARNSEKGGDHVQRGS